MIPADHPVSQYEFDVMVGADGKRNTLHGMCSNCSCMGLLFSTFQQLLLTKLLFEIVKSVFEALEQS